MLLRRLGVVRMDLKDDWGVCSLKITGKILYSWLAFENVKYKIGHVKGKSTQHRHLRT